MSTDKKSGDRTNITTTLITVIGGIIVAVIASIVAPLLIRSLAPSPPLKPTPTATPTPQSNFIYPPLPLQDIFGQLGDGKEFTYNNSMERAEQVRVEFVQKAPCRRLGEYGLKLSYNFTGERNGGWGVGWRRAPSGPFNASGFTHLKFWVKGLKDGNEKFQIGLKDMREKETILQSNELIVNISEWSEISIPLNRFTDVNLSSLENFSFSFDKNHGRGDICIDEIAFIK